MNNYYTTISFPSLGIEFDPIRSFTLGPLTIHLYGIIIALGLLLAVLYAWRRCKEFGIRDDDLTDGVLWIVPFAILCARAYYVIFKWKLEFADEPITALYIWQGGLAIYGGVLGAAVGVAVFCRIRKIKLPVLLDLVSLGFLIGQSMGRWGNFFNREAFGYETQGFLRMGLYNWLTDTTTYHHPTFLYESVWNAVGFVALHYLSKRRQYDGQIALGYAAWYGLGRTIIEGLRTDSLYIGQLRASQLLAALTCFAAVVVLLVMMFRDHSPEKLNVNQVAAKAAREAEEAAKATQAAEEAEAAEQTAPEVPEAAEEPTQEEKAAPEEQ